MTEVCGCCNLNEPEVKKRRVLGYGSLVIAFALAILSKLHPPPGWLQWGPVVPFFFAFLNLMQARTRTCVLLAIVDRDMTEGQLQPVSDRETGWKLKKRSYKMIAAAAALAFLLTGLLIRV